MEIAIIGGGHGCYAAAAEMTDQGHRVRLWRRDVEALDAIANGLTLRDFKGQRIVQIAHLCRRIEDAVAGAELIITPLPAHTHTTLAARIAPLLEEGQVVYLPPGTFGSAIFAQAMAEAGNRAAVSFAETGTLPYLARKHSESEVVVSVYAKRLPTGIWPARQDPQARAVIAQAYPCIEPQPDALAAALLNAGPIIHPPLIIMNAGPLQHFQHWDIHNEGTQSTIRAVTNTLDAERVAIREALGYGAPHFPLANHYATEGEEWMYGRGAHDRLTDSGDWREQIDLYHHRYMLEDTKLGLSLLVSLGRYASVATPVASALLAIASAMTGTDLYAEGRTLESLGLAQESRSELRDLLQNGY